MHAYLWPCKPDCVLLMMNCIVLAAYFKRAAERQYLKLNSIAQHKVADFHGVCSCEGLRLSSHRSAGQIWSYLELENAAQVVVGHAQPLRLLGCSCLGVGRHSACDCWVGGRAELQLDADAVALDGLICAPCLPAQHASLSCFCLR